MLRRRLSPPPKPAVLVGASGSEGNEGARGAGSRLTPVLVDYFGRDGSTAMIRLLASSPEIVVEGGYPFELQRFAGIVRDVGDHGSRGEVERRWARFAQGLVAGAPDARYYAEKVVDVRDLVAASLPEVRLLVLLRDPRDTLVSIEAFSRAVGPEELGGGGGGEARLERFVERQRSRLRWIAALEQGEGTLVVGYRDLVADLPGVAARVAEWLGVVLDPGEVASDFRLRWVHGTAPDPQRSLGRWREELDPAVAERLRRELGEEMEAVGLEV